MTCILLNEGACSVPDCQYSDPDTELWLQTDWTALSALKVEDRGSDHPSPLRLALCHQPASLWSLDSLCRGTQNYRSSLLYPFLFFLQYTVAGISF